MMQLTPDCAIGVFDSGIGGLSVLQVMQRVLPCETFYYVADSGYAPYGNKPTEFIEQRAFTITEFLIKKNIKALVIACNTATYAVAERLREHYPALTIIAMEPGIKPAVAATRSGVIGVLATENTLSSQRFQKLVDACATDKTILIQPCYGLVEKIEKGELTSNATRDLLKQYIDPLMAQHVDTLVLGCTHYPFVSQLIQEVAGKHVHLIETAEAVAKHLRCRLMEKALLTTHVSPGQLSVWSSAAAENSAPLISMILGKTVSVKSLSEQ